MVKPFKEGKVWSFRLRLKGENIYKTGFATSALARKEAERLHHALKNAAQPKGEGPWRTTVAQALQMYGLERLPSLKGAEKELNRINRYLRLASLPLLKAHFVPPAKTDAEQQASQKVYWQIEAVPFSAERRIPKGLGQHRDQLKVKRAHSDRVRQQLANMPMVEVRPYHLQELVDAMQADGYEAATIGLERALLRRLFNYARKIWLWIEPVKNPATDLTLPGIDNARDRVLTNAEWEKVLAALEAAKNPLVAPAIALLLDTAMRVSEPLWQTCWEQVDWQRCTLHLTDAKAGARDVPLNPSAMDILRFLKQTRVDENDPRILPLTYETLKAAWRRACKAAGITDVRIHDLRHTAATRFSLELNGNLPVLKVITGHKTYSQLSRYINLKAADVARLMHGRPLSDAEAPAGLQRWRPELVQEAQLDGDLPSNVVSLFPRCTSTSKANPG